MGWAKTQFQVRSFFRTDRNALQFTWFASGRCIIGQCNETQIFVHLARWRRRCTLYRIMYPKLNAFGYNNNKNSTLSLIRALCCCTFYSRIIYWCASTWMRQTAAGLSNRRIISFGDKLLSALQRHPTTAGPWLFSSLDGYSGSSSKREKEEKIGLDALHNSYSTYHQRLVVDVDVTCENVIKTKHK